MATYKVMATADPLVAPVAVAAVALTESEALRSWLVGSSNLALGLLFDKVLGDPALERNSLALPDPWMDILPDRNFDDPRW